MPKSATPSSKNVPSFDAPRHKPRWLFALLAFMLGCWVLVAMVDYGPEQRGLISQNTTHEIERNLVGGIGADIARYGFVWFGLIAWLIPIFIFWSCWLALRYPRSLTNTRYSAMSVALVSGTALAAMIHIEIFDESQWFPGGRLGGGLGALIYNDILEGTLGLFGSCTLLTTVYTMALCFVVMKDINAEIERTIQSFRHWQENRHQKRQGEAETTTTAEPARAGPAATRRQTTSSGGPTPAAGANVKLALARPETTNSPATPETKPTEVVPPFAAPPLVATKTENTATDTKALAVEAGGRFELNIVKAEEPKKARPASSPVPIAEDNYKFPPLTLLKDQVSPGPENSVDEHRRNADNLLRILGEFGVEVTMGEIHVGPVITRYELAPAAGVRVERISGLDKNIALGMRAQSVRILAPIPGKAAVGVEVPNQHPTPVGMREIVESEEWSSTKSELPIALGKDVSGKPLISDLTKMPHLLIAGATGSGKSVCINSIVASILYSKSPRDVRMLMVDPKVVELKVFNSLPHMLIPVVTEPKKVPGALKWLLGEMEQRYQMFAKCNVRNIVGFNGRKRREGAEPAPGLIQPTLEGVDPLADEDIELPDRLPYIVAIIDELADLMMVAPAEIETSIARLAQLARAAGIHLIIATQRPSVNVITGVIKANLPSRIAFQVASQVDSRTILDGKGAETLIGRGDMLFSPPGSSRLVRAQGAFVSDDEILQLVEFLKVNGPPQYAQSVQQQIDRAADDEDKGDDDAEVEEEDVDDELYKKAIDVLRSTKRASTSMIQRRLRIGYNRAARIIELMEERGVVGPENGSSPREILQDLDNL